MTDNSFTKFVPGFEFLQGLVKNAGSALPGIGQWVAPTLNPEELGKRIEELRTVQFWLEQNARMLAATIQALEVQRMTLSTLQTMNVPLNQLRDSLKLPEATAWPAIPPEIMAAAAPVAQAAAKTAVKTATTSAKTAAKVAAKTVKTAGDAAKAAADNPAAVVDPTQWWTALSQQFTQLATSAMKDTATDAARNLAGNLVKQSFDAASDTLKRAVSVPGTVVGSVAKGLAAGAAPKPATKAAAKTAKPRAAARRKA
jgi:hypothetical protein